MEESAKASDEAQSAYLNYLKSVSEEHAERERRMRERTENLEKMLSDSKERNATLEMKVHKLLRELEIEKMKGTIQQEFNESFPDMGEKEMQMKNQIHMLEKNIEEKNLKVIKEKEEEVQALIKEFTTERNALVKSYERRLRERKTDEEECWRKENEKLKLTVKRLQQKLANLQVKSAIVETKDISAEESSNSITENRGREVHELNSLMRENLALKKEINELKNGRPPDEKRQPHYAEDPSKTASEHESDRTDTTELRRRITVLENELKGERNLLEDYKEKSSRLEQQIARMNAKQGQRPEEMRQRKHGAGKEDELAWTNLYGIKRAGRGREASVSADDLAAPEAHGGEGKRPTRARSESLAPNSHAEKGRQEARSEQKQESLRCSEEENDFQILELRRQMTVLEGRMAEEKATRCLLEGKLAHMEMEAREKNRLEEEVKSLRRRIEREFVSRAEVEFLRHERELEDLRRRKREAAKRSEDGSPANHSDYKLKCERFAREMEKSEEIRKRIESTANGLSSSVRRPLPQEHSLLGRSVKPRLEDPAPLDLEPQVKFRLNKELERSIQKHLAGESIAGVPCLP